MYCIYIENKYFFNSLLLQLMLDPLKTACFSYYSLWVSMETESVPAYLFRPIAP